MVCTKCEKKLSKLAAPDPFQPSSSTRTVGENKLAVKGRPGTSTKRFTPYGSKCKDCKSNTTQNQAKYCHGCAFKRGACAICGKKILDTSGYAMSNK
ncbi:PDZ-binding protein [Cantharellus anzutake]|uniref:PDZ-binding protein n=1 Tax=Cantharellus anzutake TaxID=1750568 RepID=UPI001905A748|nr:PDZ-binding protein [Cantharellus anzutake]KAF8331682.1 PDZ-binding protein [Cantharellus anzutake]